MAKYDCIFKSGVTLCDENRFRMEECLLEFLSLAAFLASGSWEESKSIGADLDDWYDAMIPTCLEPRHKSVGRKFNRREARAMTIEIAEKVLNILQSDSTGR